MKVFVVKKNNVITALYDNAQAAEAHRKAEMKATDCCCVLDSMEVLKEYEKKKNMKLYTLVDEDGQKFFESEGINEIVDFEDIEFNKVSHLARSYLATADELGKLHLATADELGDYFGLGNFDPNFSYEEGCEYFKDVQIWTNICRKYNIEIDLLETPNDWAFTKEDQEKYGNVFVEAFSSICSVSKDNWFD